MSSKPFKSPERNNSEPSAFELTIIHKKVWRNTWSFNLHRTIPLGNGKYDERTKKEMIKKYYGKKILYISKPQQAKVLVSRSKLLEDVGIAGPRIFSKSKGNLVIQPQFFRRYERSRNAWILWKKVLKNCPIAKLVMFDPHDLKMAKYLLAVRHLSAEEMRESVLALFGVIRNNLLNLETLKVEMKRRNSVILQSKKSKDEPFVSLLKLPRLKRAKFKINSESFEQAEFGGDLERFYSQPRSFKLSITICGKEWYEPGNSNLSKIIKRAEFLGIYDMRKNANGEKKPLMAIEKEEMRRLKSGKKNCVKIISESFNTKVDIAKILSYSDSLENLFISERRERIRGGFPQKQEEFKGLRNLKLVALQFEHLYVRSDQSEGEYDGVFGGYSSPLLSILSLLREQSPCLQHLSVYFSSDFRQKHGPFESFIEHFVRTVSTFDKLKTLGLLMYAKALKNFNPGQILSNRSLESFKLQLRKEEIQEIGNLPSHEWDPWFITEDKSGLKKLIITVPEGVNFPLFEVNLLNLVGKLENLEIVELVDENLELITFDFLYAFVTSLLEKKKMRKILICTKVKNNLYIENSQTVLPKHFKTHFEYIFNEISRELENKVEKLQLEEVLVGRLMGYNFDYLFMSKEMGMVNKLFWKQKEIDGLLLGEKKLTKRHQEILNMFRKPKGEK